MSNDVIKVGASVPSFMADGNKSLGFIEDDAALLTPPRLKILQAMSTETAEEKGKQGTFYSTHHQEPIGKRCYIVPLRFHREWVKFEDGGASNVEWRTSNPNDPRVTDDENSFKYEQMNVLVVAPFNDAKIEAVPMILSLGGYDRKTARKWYQTAKGYAFASQPLPLCGQVWELILPSKANQKNEKGAWFTLEDIQFHGAVQDADSYRKLLGLASEHATVQLAPDMEAAAKKSEEKDEDLPF